MITSTFRLPLAVMCAAIPCFAWGQDITVPYAFKVDGANAVSIIGSTTNSVGLLLQNTVTGGRSYSLFSSGSGPAPVGTLGVWDNTANVLRFVLDPNGNFGIGTASPTGRLNAKQGGSDLMFREQASNAELWLSSSGNVYADMHFATQGTDQVSLRGSSYGFNIKGPAARLAINAPDVNRAEALYVAGKSVFVGSQDDNQGLVRAESQGSTNASFLTKNPRSTVQMMSWEHYGARIGVRQILADASGFPAGLGNLYFTTGADAVRAYFQNSDGSLIIGSDVGGTEGLRVANGIRVGNAKNMVWPGTAPNRYAKFLTQADNNFVLYATDSSGAERPILSTYVNAADKALRIQVATVIGPDPAPASASLLRVGGGADIKGTVKTSEVVVTATGWADGIFSDDYKLPSLAVVERHISEKRHLPGIPSEAEIMKDGIPLADMQRRQMAKIEELTLYAIQADKQIGDLKADKMKLEERLSAIESLLKNIAGK